MHIGMIALVAFTVGVCVGAGYAISQFDLKVQWHAEDRETVHRP